MTAYRDDNAALRHRLELETRRAEVAEERLEPSRRAARPA